MARKKRATTAKKAPAKRRSNTTIVVAKTRHHKKRAVRGTSVGSTHHTKKRKKRSSGSIMGFTGTSLKLKDALHMAGGVAAGIIINHKVLRPIEAHLTEKQPMVAKAMGFLQAGLGFVVAVKGKHMATKAAGVTIMTGGVNTVLRQFDVEKHIPGIAGSNDDWTTVKIPMNGPTELRSMVAGLLESNETPVMQQVAGHHHRSRRTMQNNTYSNPNEGINQDYRLRSYVGDSEFDIIMPAKGAYL